MNIVLYVNNEDHQPWLQAARQLLAGADVREWQADSDPGWQADYALVWQPPEAMFKHHTGLKGIINLGAGVDKLLAVPGLPDDVPVLKLRDAGMAEWMTDYVRYGLLHFCRDFDIYARQQKQHRWQGRGIDARSDWPVGILGLGAIGGKVAQALAADGYSVSGWSRSLKQLDGVDCYAGADGLAEFLGQTRVLVNLLPCSAHTQKFINADMLNQLRAEAVVINAGRGEVVDSPALIAALRDGHLRGAMLDVFELEPLSQDSPLWAMDNVIITPHVAAPTSVEDAIAQAKEYIHALGQGLPVNAVDRQLGY